MPDTATIASTPGTRGHTRTTWDHGLRGLFRRLREENPRANKAELQTLFMTEYLQDDDLMEAAGIRVFGNDWTSWYVQLDEEEPEPELRSAPVRQPQPARRSRERFAADEVAAEAASLVERVRATLLLELDEANGKKLGDCTAGELRALGGWRIKIADRIGDDSAIVRERISQADAAQLCDEAGIGVGEAGR